MRRVFLRPHNYVGFERRYRHEGVIEPRRSVEFDPFRT